MSHARLIVCERTSRWAVAFRRALGRRMDLICETRSMAQCEREVTAARHCVIALEVTQANYETALAAVARWSRSFPEARVIALLEDDCHELALALREAGAIAVLESRRQAAGVARLALRHLALAPPEEFSMRQAIYRRLPWAAWASQAS
jgi:hypothetical protein